MLHTEIAFMLGLIVGTVSIAATLWVISRQH